MLHSFYSKLYSRGTTNAAAKFDFWGDITLRQMTPGHVTSLVSHITTADVRAAITKLKNNKAPGPDGLSTDFYTILCPNIEDILA